MSHLDADTMICTHANEQPSKRRGQCRDTASASGSGWQNLPMATRQPVDSTASTVRPLDMATLDFPHRIRASHLLFGSTDGGHFPVYIT